MAGGFGCRQDGKLTVLGHGNSRCPMISGGEVGARGAGFAVRKCRSRPAVTDAGGDGLKNRRLDAGPPG